MSDGEPQGARKIRSYEYAVAGLDHRAALSMSGLDYMRALVAGELGARPSISDTIGMSLPREIEYGRVVFEAQAADFLLNPLGVIHGGFAATLLDSAMGCAVHTALPAATGYTTAELKINYTRAMTPETGLLRAEGAVIHVGRRMATAEGRLLGEDGKLYAHGSTTCFVFPLKG
ncbi:MAG: PaaI family thioesterase [Pikeienuella sp.]